MVQLLEPDGVRVFDPASAGRPYQVLVFAAIVTAASVAATKDFICIRIIKLIIRKFKID